MANTRLLLLLMLTVLPWGCGRAGSVRPPELPGEPPDGLAPVAEKGGTIRLTLWATGKIVESPEEGLVLEYSGSISGRERLPAGFRASRKSFEYRKSYILELYPTPQHENYAIENVGNGPDLQGLIGHLRVLFKGTWLSYVYSHPAG